MSRSYKKHPFIKDGGRSSKKDKQLANRAVRRGNKDLSKKGKGYKRIYCSYDINDYISRWPWKEAKKEWETNSWWRNYFLSEKEFYNYWAKCYKRK